MEQQHRQAPPQLRIEITGTLTYYDGITAELHDAFGQF